VDLEAAVLLRTPGAVPAAKSRQRASRR